MTGINGARICRPAASQSVPSTGRCGRCAGGSPTSGATVPAQACWANQSAWGESVCGFAARTRSKFGFQSTIQRPKAASCFGASA